MTINQNGSNLMTDLKPAESMALTVARTQVERGDNPQFSVTALLVLALDRLTGRKDWTEPEAAWSSPPGTDRPCACSLSPAECAEAGLLAVADTRHLITRTQPDMPS